MEIRVAAETIKPVDGLVAKLVLEAGLKAVGTGEKLLDRIHKHLDGKKMLGRSGSVFLSAEAALHSECQTYFLGLNPGGTDDELNPINTVAESLCSTRLAVNAFDQDWSSERRTFKPGRAPMQKRFKYIADWLGLAYGDIPAANLVFTRSASISEHNSFYLDRDAVAPVHQLIMDEIKPSRLWIMGDVRHAATLLKFTKEEWRDSGYKNWSIGRGHGYFCGHQVEICHTPHLSFWDPSTNLKALKFAFAT